MKKIIKKISKYLVIYSIVVASIYLFCAFYNSKDIELKYNSGPKLSLNKNTIYLEVGSSEILKLTYNKKTKNIIWTSSNNEIASVNNDGEVIALNEGETKITVKDGKEEAICDVIVLNSEDENITSEDRFIIFDLNREIYNVVQKKKIVDNQLPKINKPVREGYTFIGYYDSKDEMYYNSECKPIKILDNNKKNIILYAGWRINTATIKFHPNGGKVKEQTEVEGKIYNWSVKDDLLYLNDNLYTTKVDYNSYLSSSGLINYNGSVLNITKDNYKAKYHSEWCTKDNVCYSQALKYHASDFCNLNKDNCIVDLYLNWVLYNYVDNNIGDLNKCSEKANKTGKIYSCVDMYQLRKNQLQNGSTQIQNFAITDNYIYYAVPLNGAWESSCKNDLNCLSKKLDTMGDSYIERVSRKKDKNGLYKRELIYTKYSGHAQSFDAASSIDEEVYLNGIGYMCYSDKHKKYMVCNGGVNITKFESNSENKGIEKIPNLIIPINTNGNLYKPIHDYNYSNKEDYYNYIKNYAYESGVKLKKGKDTKKIDVLNNAEVAVDYRGTKIALVSGKTLYYYDDMIDFKNGNSKPKKYILNTTLSKQGVDLYNNGKEVFFYLFNGADAFNEKSATYYLEKYKIDSSKNDTTLSPIKTKSINMWSYFKNYIKDSKIFCKISKVESEGISIDGSGNIYLGLVVRYKRCDGGGTDLYNTIFSIGNF